MRHVVPVDRQAGARDVARAREPDAAPLRQLAKFLLPLRSVDHFRDAFAESHRAHAQIVRREGVGWDQRPQTELRGIDFQLLGDLVEVHLDKIAEQLEIDPAELRLRTLVPPNSLTANYLRVGSMGLGKCIAKVVDGSEWKKKFRKLPEGRGVGLACSSYISGAGLPIYWNNMPHSGVQLKCDRGGGVTVFCGSTEIGQGSDSILAYIVAEVLGVDPFDVAVVTADTDLTPVDLGSYSSRVTLMSGNAALQAAERARQILAVHAAKKLQVPVERLTFAEGRVFDAADQKRGISFAEAVQLAEAAQGMIGTVGSYTPPPSAAKYRGAGVGPSPAYSYSACVAEVEVDPETGIVRVPTIWIAHDVGRSINSASVIGQVEGSIYMGLGEEIGRAHV